MTRWTLTFRAEGDGRPVECRVRRLLKLALRACRLQCVNVELLAPEFHVDKQRKNNVNAAEPGKPEAAQFAPQRARKRHPAGGPEKN